MLGIALILVYITALIVCFIYFFGRYNWSAYLIAHATKFDFKNDLSIEARAQKDGKHKWVLLHYTNNVYNKVDNDFEYEPLPSSRTAEFIRNTRFDTFISAYIAYRKVLRQWRKTNLPKTK